MSDHSTLLKLRRQYSKDETVKWLSDELAKRDIEIGMLKSELAEWKDNAKVEKLKHQIVNYKRDNSRLKILLKQKQLKELEK